MEIDLELFRREVRLSTDPPVCLSVIDISPDRPLRALVFIHGFGGKALQWQYQLSRFARANRVIAVDLRGHGRSDRSSAPASMDLIQADLLGLLDVLVPSGKIVLVGHSFGGAIASQFAAAHPERVERLALIATPVEYRLNPVYRFVLRMPVPFLRLLDPFTHAWLGAAPHVLKSWYDHNLCCWQGPEQFRRLAVPTLVIRGHLDSVFEKPAYEEVTRLIPQAEEVDVGASGHLVMLERRDAVNRAIARFIDTDRRSWSQAQPADEDPQRASLLLERPWLAHYDQGVPYTLAIPPVPLPNLLDSAVRRYPSNIALNFENHRLNYRRLEQEVNRFANTLRWLGGWQRRPGDLIPAKLAAAGYQFLRHAQSRRRGGLYFAHYRTRRADPPDRGVGRQRAGYLDPVRRAGLPDQEQTGTRRRIAPASHHIHPHRRLPAPAQAPEAAIQPRAA